MTCWRLRRCPSCRRVRPAGEYRLHPDDLGARWHTEPARRVCPGCGFCGYTRQFQDVREIHPAAVEAITRTLTAPARREVREQAVQMRMLPEVPYE